MNKIVTVVLGGQWGDEGKGKIIDLISCNADAVCRCQGGNNAGHTVVVNNEKHAFHLLPSGVLQPKCINILGNGVVIHIKSFFEELDTLKSFSGSLDVSNRLFISERAHIVFDFHQEVDAILEKYKGNKSLGTTKKGIGPAYSTKVMRDGIRMIDLIKNFETFREKFIYLTNFYMKVFPELKIDVSKELAIYEEYATKIKPYIINTTHLLNKMLQDPSKLILVEGANACMLDIDFGTYPYVTSSNCSIGGVITGLGIPPQVIGQVCGIVKAYTTRVGAGPFPTELHDEIGEKLRQRGGEFGTTTHRPRRCGWLDLMVVKYTNIINSYTYLAITKLDILDDFEEIKIGVDYKLDGKLCLDFPADLEDLSRVEVEYIKVKGWQVSTEKCRQFADLPQLAQEYICKIEELTKIPVKWIGVGQERSSIIQLF